MKQLNRYILFIFVICIAMYFGFSLLFSKLLGKPVFYDELLLTSVTMSLFYALLQYYLTGLSLKPKLKFLESAETIVPPFGNKIDKTFQVKDDDFSLEALKLKIEKTKYISTFFDKEKRILKFRSRFGLHTTDLGGSIVYDKENKIISFSCFPFHGYTETAVKKTQKALEQIEKIIQSV